MRGFGLSSGQHFELAKKSSSQFINQGRRQSEGYHHKLKKIIVKVCLQVLIRFKTRKGYNLKKVTRKSIFFLLVDHKTPAP